MFSTLLSSFALFVVDYALVLILRLVACCVGSLLVVAFGFGISCLFEWVVFWVSWFWLVLVLVIRVCFASSLQDVLSRWLFSLITF